MFNILLLETKMNTSLYRWSVNILLAVGVFICAKIGQKLGIFEPIAISVFWPAAGLSLAAILLFGYSVWPGILVGNLLYNFTHLYSIDHNILNATFTSLGVSLASMTQAIVGGYIIKRYSSPTLFKTVKDVFVFLIPGGLIAGLIACTFGILFFYAGGYIPKADLMTNFITFWVGDTMGIFLLTPLLVIWLTRNQSVAWSEYKWEGLCMVGVYIILSILNFQLNLPLGHFYIPLCIWIAYRYRMHGASLAVLIIALTAIIPTAMQMGSFYKVLAFAQLPLLISFLEIITGTSLVVAAVTNEREQALNLLKNDNKSLQNSLSESKGELEDIQEEIAVKDKLASMSLLTQSLAKQMHNPLMKINDFIKQSMEDLNNIKQSFDMYKTVLDSDETKVISDKLLHLEEEIANLCKSSTEANKIFDVIEKQSSRIDPGGIKISSINIHTFLNAYLDQILSEKANLFPGFDLTIVKEYDRAVNMIPGMPLDLAEAFLHIFDQSIQSMVQKRIKLGSNYEPTLIVSTFNGHGDITINIRDNGVGMSENMVKDYFHSIISPQSPADPENLNLSLAYDIIFHLHNGDIKVQSIENEYLLFTITLPKNHKKSKLAA